MAIVKFDPGISGVRGTIDGITYTANQSGAYGRSLARGPQSSTPLQTNARQSISIIGKLWGPLAQADRDDWDTWASDPAQEQHDAFGNAYYLTGFQWFVKVNRNINLNFFPYRLTFPDSNHPAKPRLNALFAWHSTSQCTLQFPEYEFAPDFSIVIFALLALPGIPTRPGSKFAYLNFQYPTGDALWVFVPPPGLNPIGTGLFLKICRQTEDGLRSPWAYIDTLFE